MTDTPPPPPPSTPPPPATPPAPAAAAAVPGKRRAVGVTILVSIVTFGIWTLVWSYQNGEEVKRFSGKGLGGVAYLIITFLLAPVTMFLLAGEVEKMYREEGKEPPITTLWGLWFLLPLIGNIIWYVRIQNALNDHWSAHGQDNKPGLT